jgi:photosystem II stability/assembly factor-like uncharacterized protein
MKYLKSLPIIFFCLIQINVDAQWYLYNPQPTDKLLYDVFFSDSLNGWAVGEDGIILQIDGENWTTVQSPTTENLRSVFFLDNQHGWAAGYGGTLLKYANQSWSIQNSNTFKDIYDLWFTDNSNGWAVGYNGLILHYNGDSWSLEDCPTNYTLRSVCFTDPGHGWAVGNEGLILKFENESWEIIPAITYYGLKSVSFVDESNGWAVGDQGTVLYFDGESWNTQTCPVSDLMSVSFVDNKDGWATGSGIVVHYDGYTWTQQNSMSYLTYAICFTSETNGYLTGKHGNIAKYDGNGWIQQSFDLGVAISSFSRAGNQFIWGFESSNEMLFYNGIDWSVLNFGNNDKTINASHFLDESKGWICGYWGTVYEYDNGTWIYHNFSGIWSVHAIYAVNEQEVWASSFSSIYKYNGSVWQLAFDCGYNINSLYFTDSQHGWAIGGIHNVQGAGHIYKYDGENWSLEYDLPGHEFWDGYFLDPITGWVVGDAGRIIKYNGIYWELQDSPTFNHLYAVYFVDQDHGWACGDYGTVLFYNGEDWQIQNSGTTAVLKDICFTDTLNGWVAGGTTMLYTTSGGNILTEVPREDDEAGTELFLVFPNPVKDKLFIKNALSISSRIEIIITDLQGKIYINQTFDFHSTPNTIQKIDICGLDSGLYICSLVSGNRKYTKKILIVE